ncbi:MAG: T9SS type A sorting domain-containing protein [Fidelibacterota bacterium]|nr:MAG: T9SS type A sorting domain-containing protein [Candidatus Neomarinimicrobiota bacterium]
MNPPRGLLYPGIVLALCIGWAHPQALSGSEGGKKVSDGIHYLTGSDYEIGVRKASLKPAEFERWNGLEQALFSGSNGPALALALEYQLTRLRECYPGLLREWQGMADETGISFMDVAIGMIGGNTLRKIAGLPGARRKYEERSFEGCSAFGVTHSDRGPILAKTSDSHGMPRDTKVWTDEDVEVIDYADGYRVLMCGYAILNNQGLAVGDANAHYEGTTTSGDGPAGRLAPIIARYCPTVDSAVSFITNYTITDDGRHFCLVDSSGRAAAVEVAPGGLVNIRWGDTTGYVYVANTSPDSVMRVHDTNDSAYVANSDHRLANFERMFTDTAYRSTFEDAESIIFSHDTLGAICQHGDSIDVQWHTSRSRLVLPAEGKYYLAARSDTGTSYHPCEHEWRVYEFPPVSQEEPIATRLPAQFELRQNYPNPFNAQTTIGYRLAVSDHVKLEVYSLSGARVKLLHSGDQQRGEYMLVWDGTDGTGRTVASGTYYYRLEVGDMILTKRMTLIK